MIVFIESIIKLIIKLFFVDQLATENEKLKQENQELAKAKAEVIENHFSLFQKYLALNQRNEELTKQLARAKFCDINQEFDPDDFKVIDQLLQDFNSSEELTI